MRWVLLRGLTREAAHWGDFPQRLAERLGGGHTVQAIDLPGSGARHRQTSPSTVAGIARDCLARAGQGEPVVLLAMSLGAMVALEWARMAPASVAGCVLVNTSAGGRSPLWHRLRPANYARLITLIAGTLPLAERERLILAMTSSRPDDHAGLPEAWADIAARRPVSWGNAARQLLAAARWRAPDDRPGAPVLLLASRGDMLVSPKCTEHLAAAWNIPVRWHASAGHDLPLDDPAWVVDTVDRWRRSMGW
jgi:pimeloyl-ACP methyl ester carboxylesterase